MDILIPDNWLRDYLKTDASAGEIAKDLSLCGPSVDRLVGTKDSLTYAIEVTTNRIDSASVVGIAREANAILPCFGFKTQLTLPEVDHNFIFTPKVSYLKADVDKTLCPRFTAVLIKGVKIGPSPKFLKDRLELVGERPINNVVDISNYVMHELGQPLHTFDYDKIKGAKMMLRASEKGERLTTLDGKTFVLKGNDIVIEDLSGKLIDLAGIMGGLNSAVDETTKNVLIFVQTYNPQNIRKTSMSLAQRSLAATYFEKGLDTEAVVPAMLRSIKLMEDLTGGKAEKEILDIYPIPKKSRFVFVNLENITKKLGIVIKTQEIERILNSLGFGTEIKDLDLKLTVPSYRSQDIKIEEDVVEEIARIYGYFNFPSVMLTGRVPEKPENSSLEFETDLKQILKGVGAIEVYTSSLIPEKIDPDKPLKLKNPLGRDTEVLRTSLRPSITEAAEYNKGYNKPFHMFELSNVYIPRKGDLPEERSILAGIFSEYPYRKAKGIVENLMDQLNIGYIFKMTSKQHFQPNTGLEILHLNEVIGEMGITRNNYIYYEFSRELLEKYTIATSEFKPLPTYPPQIEDITLSIPEGVYSGKVMDAIKSANPKIENVELVDIFKNSYTFRVWYQDPEKTLSDKDVSSIRSDLLYFLKKTFNISQK